MRRKLLALACLLAIILGVFAIGAAATTAETDGKYDVGYSKVNVNPFIQTTAVDYLDPANPNAIGIPNKSKNWTDAADNVVQIDVTDPDDATKTVKVPFVSTTMAGFGTYSTPSCDSLLDDNGDGKVGLGDGLYATVTTVTDDWGSTVIYVTIDSIGGYAGLTSSLRQTIPAALKELTGKDVLTGDRIMVSANHSHNSVNIDNCRSEYLKKVNGTYVNQDENGNATTARGAYFKYYLDTVTKAAVEAYQNATPAVMSKGAIDVSDALGYQMNFVRHYNVDAYDNRNVREKNLVRGSNFGPTPGDAATKNVVYKNSGFAYKSHLYEADDMLYTLQFTPDDTSLQPIVFVNWRAHSTIVSGSSKTYLSADYASSLRRFMEEADYRPAFWQGAAGNLVPSSADPEIKDKGIDWSTIRRDDLGITYSAENQLAYKAVLYGKMLTEATVKCLTDTSAMKTISAGPIRSTQYSFTADLQIVEEGSGVAAAAKYWAETLGKPKTYYKDANGVEQSSLGKVYPLEYTHTDGKVYILNSYFHANNMYNRYTSTSKTTKYELNAITMGDEFALVTSPCEMFDRYDLDGSNVFADNDWLELVGETYGTPFVAGYSNAHGPYLSNISGFHYNENAKHYAAGCYEANTSIPAEGNGEAVIQSLKKMLNVVTEGYKEESCVACGKEVTWEPLLQTDKLTVADGGHYYLLEDVTYSVPYVVPADATVCFDLAGHKASWNSRAFEVPAGATLNLFDSAASGEVVVYANNGAVVGGICQPHGTVNIYGGTYSVTGEDESKYPVAGGLFAAYAGKLNIYGGTLLGTSLTDGDYSYAINEGFGSAIYLYNRAELFVGGEAKITSGTVPSGDFGTCIYAHDRNCKITLQGNANVDEIYYPTINGTSLTVSGAYTGAANLRLGPDIALTDGMDIGTSTNANLSGATITCVNDPEYKLFVSGENLVLQRNPVAYIGDKAYFTFQDALDAAQAGTAIRLAMDIAETVTVSKNVTIDLNGFDIANIVADNCTVSCYDSQTDDYNVSDEVYGKVTGNVIAAEGYMTVTETDGLSFHKVSLNITAMSLRASQAGVYYKSNFQADEVAAMYIKQYGVALSVKGEPNETNSTFSCFTNFANGNATGTLLKNIMKTSNSVANNNRNANMAIYGRPYILTKDNQYIFGTTVQRSLKQQLEAIDAAWANYSEAAKNTVFRMFKSFKSTMDSWNIPNIKRDADPGSDGILKVLIVGNSHGLDSTNLLCEVLKDQGLKSEKFVVGALYKSGCNMGEHATFVTNNTGYETYNENGGPNDANGVAWEVIKNPASTLPFDRHQWDIVIMQQMNHRAGINEYVKSQFLTVLNFIDDHQIGSPKMGWQMIWANPATMLGLSDQAWVDQHEAWYGTGAAGSYKSINMYNKVVACTQEYITDSTEFLGKDYFDFVIPAATTIQYARDVLGYTEAQLYRDHTHLSDFGRLMSAYTWYGKIMECVNGEPQTISNVDITAVPAGLAHENSTYPAKSNNYAVTEQMQDDIKKAVNWALAHPYELPAAQ